MALHKKADLSVFTHELHSNGYKRRAKEVLWRMMRNLQIICSKFRWDQNRYPYTRGILNPGTPAEQALNLAWIGSDPVVEIIRYGSYLVNLFHFFS
jgi:hypothetical protein